MPQAAARESGIATLFAPPWPRSSPQALWQPVDGAIDAPRRRAAPLLPAIAAAGGLVARRGSDRRLEAAITRARRPSLRQTFRERRPATSGSTSRTTAISARVANSITSGNVLTTPRELARGSRLTVGSRRDRLGGHAACRWIVRCDAGSGTCARGVGALLGRRRVTASPYVAQGAAGVVATDGPRRRRRADRRCTRRAAARGEAARDVAARSFASAMTPAIERALLRRASGAAADVRHAVKEQITMCGITGIFDTRGTARHRPRRCLSRMNESQHHRGPDEGGIARRARRRARPSAAVDHRPVDRPAAAVQRGRQRRRRLQRRDLQLPGADPRADGARPRVPHAQRHRGHRPRLGGVGRGVRRALPRHVRVRAVGPQPRDAVPRARPARRQAAVLRAAAGRHAACSAPS